jgi:hypothetical protein
VMAAIFFRHAVASLSMLGLALVQERFITDPHVTYRYRRLRDGKEGRWGEVTKDQRDGDSWLRVHVPWPLQY